MRQHESSATVATPEVSILTNPMFAVDNRDATGRTDEIVLGGNVMSEPTAKNDKDCQEKCGALEEHIPQAHW
jgi:hypothetical protein